MHYTEVILEFYCGICGAQFKKPIRRKKKVYCPNCECGDDVRRKIPSLEELKAAGISIVGV